jgi:hypothetical protein
MLRGQTTSWGVVGGVSVSAPREELKPNATGSAQAQLPDVDRPRRG